MRTGSQSGIESSISTSRRIARFRRFRLKLKESSVSKLRTRHGAHEFKTANVETLPACANTDLGLANGAWIRTPRQERENLYSKGDRKPYIVDEVQEEYFGFAAK